MRNSTTLELSRFIDNRLTDVTKSARRNYNCQNDLVDMNNNMVDD